MCEKGVDDTQNETHLCIPAHGFVFAFAAFRAAFTAGYRGGGLAQSPLVARLGRPLQRDGGRGSRIFLLRTLR